MKNVFIICVYLLGLVFLFGGCAAVEQKIEQPVVPAESGPSEELIKQVAELRQKLDALEKEYRSLVQLNELNRKMLETFLNQEPDIAPETTESGNEELVALFKFSGVDVEKLAGQLEFSPENTYAEFIPLPRAGALIIVDIADNIGRFRSDPALSAAETFQAFNISSPDKFKEFAIGQAGLAPEDLPDDPALFKDYSVALLKIINGEDIAPNDITIEDIQFAAQIDPDNNPVSASMTFAQQTDSIFACYPNIGLLKNLPKVISRWTRTDTNGQIYLDSVPANPKASFNCVRVEKTDGWLDGRYLVELFNTRTLEKIAEGFFIIK